MKVKILGEAGGPWAREGLRLSYNQPLEKMGEVAYKLATQDDGHNKFLESIVAWLDITAPRYWWQQFDTYRIGVTKQSESTMHTILNRPLTQKDFEGDICEETLNRLNNLIAKEDFLQLKLELPESFLQRRIVCLNYKVLRHIIKQRKHHRLPEWPYFCYNILDNLRYKEYLRDLVYC